MAGTSRVSIRSALLLALAGCSPTFDWRDVRFPEAGDAAMLFPCKPDRLSRTLRLAGEDVQFALATCSTGSLTFAFGHAELADAGRTGQAIAQMSDAVSAHLRARALERPSPLPASIRLQWQGQKPDGTALQETAVLARRGHRVFQASVLGATVDAELADTFLASLKVPAP